MSKSEQEINFSIVVPHRGPQEELRRCLASVPQRADVEVLVEDGELGAGYARNKALARARGHWLVFADSDDVFAPEMAQVMERYARVRDIDMVLLGAESVDDAGRGTPMPIVRHMRWAKRSALGEAVAKYATWTPWSRMVRRELAEGLRFEEVPVGNDAVFVLSCTARARRVALDATLAYRYSQPSAGSQTSAHYGDETIVLRHHLRLKINDIYRRVGYPFLWPVRKNVAWRRLSPEQTEQMKALLEAHGHGFWRELRARASQGLLKIIGWLWG